MDQLTIYTSADGSHTIYSDKYHQHYHSVHGAIQESVHVFINAGLKAIALPEVSILEIGFGTGLNCFLTFLESERSNLKISYTAIEPEPLSNKMISKLNFPEALDVSYKKHHLQKIHQCAWDRFETISANFHLKKIQEMVQETLFVEEFDLVYYDAFGPGAQPELWTEEVLSIVCKTLKIGGVFVTYCAKGEVKRILKRNGLTVESLPGPPGKREMIRAIKI
jgi:tRNA U34 5-methylaminomethyl-2-thiouridine-forming methyltransferase MnmC